MEARQRPLTQQFQPSERPPVHADARRVSGACTWMGGWPDVPALAEGQRVLAEAGRWNVSQPGNKSPWEFRGCLGSRHAPRVSHKCIPFCRAEEPCVCTGSFKLNVGKRRVLSKQNSLAFPKAGARLSCRLRPLLSTGCLFYLLSFCTPQARCKEAARGWRTPVQHRRPCYSARALLGNQVQGFIRGFTCCCPQPRWG